MAAGALMSVASTYLMRDVSHTNDFVTLFPLELIGMVLAGLLATVGVLARRTSPEATLAVGLYIVVVAVAIGTLLPLWLPQDNTVLGSALLAGVLAGVGTSIALVSAAVLADSTSVAARATAGAGGVLVFLLVTAGGMVYPLLQLRLPLLVLAVVALVVVRGAWRQRQRLRWLLLQMLAGSAVTITLFVLRGPDDWSSASRSLRLFSLPILIFALGISLAMTARPSSQMASGAELI